MTISQMQNKYDIIANEIEIDDVKMFNEDGDGTHTPSVYEYVQFSIDNEERFLAWLLEDDDIESKYDLDEEQQEELDEFVKFCENFKDDIPRARAKVITEHGEDIDVFDCRSDLLSYEYKGKQYDISGEFYVDNNGYLHHTHCDNGEEFEIKYLLHEDW